MPEILAAFDRLGKSFPGMTAPALDGVSGAIRTGGVTGLVGPDGAGKTTLLRLVAGLLEPTTGSVATFGLNPAQYHPELRHQLAYMPQKFGLYEDLTVAENLTLHAELRGVVGPQRAETFARLLEFTGLQPYTRRHAGKLSGGMKQKLGLACALLGSPRLLLLDEPGVGVDPISRRELRRMVGELVEGGMAVVWSTAYLEEAELCETTLVLHEGRVVFSGPPGDMTAPMAGRVWQWRDPGPDKRRVLARALARPEISDGTIQGEHLRVTFRADAAMPPPAGLLGGAGGSWRQVAPRFEDAFIERLGGGPGGESVLARHIRAIPPGEGVVIEAERLTRRFGDFTATDAVTFRVRRGEIYGLLGPNGAGKSTTFKMMCGLLKPSSGRALVVGMDLRRSAGRARQKLGYMAQKFSLYGSLTVRQNLGFFAGIYGLSGGRGRDMTAAMAGAFHLQPYLDVAAESLSLGFKQRLALACAVMHEPDLLFLDEPTSGVDPVTRREFWTHIHAMVERGVTVMVTTHFMDEAEYCDRIGLVYQGRLIAEGPPDALKQTAAKLTGRAEPSMEDAFVALVSRGAGSNGSGSRDG